MVSPFWELFFGPHSPFNFLLLEANQRKARHTHLHELPPLIPMLTSKGRESTLISVMPGRGTAALWALIPLFQATRSFFSPSGLWVLWWNHETLNKLSKETAQTRDCPWSHSPDRFYQAAAANIFLIDIFRRSSEVWWSMSENTNPRAHRIRVRGVSRSRMD